MPAAMKKVFAELAGERHEKPVSNIKLLLSLRGAAIILVVLAHAVIGMLAAEVSLVPDAGLGVAAIGPWQVASPLKSMILEVCRCAVPVFLFLCGYYMLSTPRTWKTIWSSSRKLLIPMAFWSLVGLAFSWRKGTGGWGAAEFLGRLATGNTQLGYFFIVLIVQYYVLSMWLIPAMARRPRTVLLAALALQLAVLAYDYLFQLSRLGLIAPITWILEAGTFPECLFPRFILSFSLGIWAAQSSQRFRSIITEKFGAVAAASVVAVLLVALERGLLYGYGRSALGMTPFEATSMSWVEWKGSTALWTIAAIFLLFGCFQKRVVAKRFLELVGKYSFQIFLLHGMVLELTGLVLYKFSGIWRFYGFAGTMICLVAGIGVPILAARLVQRRFPAPLRVLFLGA